MIHHGHTWTERKTSSQYHESAAKTSLPPRQAFNRSHTSLGAAGHWLHLAGGMAPVIIGELITDPGKYRKAVRIAAVATTVGYELLYTIKEQHRREEQEAKLATCRSRD